MTAMSEMWHRAADGVIEDMLSQSETYFDVKAALTADEAPTLLMAADPALDASLRPDEAKRALDLLPRGSLVTVAGAAHAIHAAKPLEFVRLVEDFASAPPAGAG